MICKIADCLRLQVCRSAYRNVCLYRIAFTLLCLGRGYDQGTSLYFHLSAFYKDHIFTLCAVRSACHCQGIPGVGIRLIHRQCTAYIQTALTRRGCRDIVVLGKLQQEISLCRNVFPMKSLQRQCTGSRLITPAVALCILCDIHGYYTAFCLLRDVKRCQGILRSYRRYLLCRLLNDIPLGNTFRCGCGLRCRRCCRFGFRCCCFGFRCCRFGFRCCRFGFRCCRFGSRCCRFGFR